MINFVDAEGRPIPSVPQIRKQSGFSVGASAARNAEAFGTTFFVPFSSLHRYQRTDSSWANAWATDLDDYTRGFASPKARLLPAFIRYDFAKDDLVELAPARVPNITFPPEAFGDDWSDELDHHDVDLLRAYFRSMSHLSKYLDFVALRVGGTEHMIELNDSRRRRGVMFAVPRASLMHAVDWEIFDDLLIGNFMKTSLYGKWPHSGLYPDFTPYVAKYGDNGRAHTDDELRHYFSEYRRRLGAFTYVRSLFEQRARRLVAARTRAESPGFRFARNTYHRLRGMT